MDGQQHYDALLARLEELGSVLVDTRAAWTRRY